MKDIKTVATQAKNQIMQGSVKPCKPKLQQEDKVITRIFAVMMVKYQQKWSSLFPDDAILEETKREWSKELGQFSMDHIAWAMDNVIDEYPEWPPTIGEFKRLCKSAEVEPLYNLPKLDNPTRPETAESAIEEMKRIVK